MLGAQSIVGKRLRQAGCFESDQVKHICFQDVLHYWISCGSKALPDFWLKDEQIFFLSLHSSEPAVPGDDEDAVVVSPEPEGEVEKEAEVAVAELKAEAMLETQTDLHTSEEPSEKNHAAAPPAAEATTGPSEAATAAPEENRVGPDLTMTSGAVTRVIKCVCCHYSPSPGHQSPVRTFLPVGQSRPQESPHMLSKSLLQHR